MADLAGQGRFAIAVSGGADSVALMRLAADWCTRHAHPSPAVVTVDHGLREGSQQEAERVSSWARVLGLDHATLTWRMQPAPSNLQSQAREARYRLIGAWMKERGLDTLLTGHTQDDQAETFLIRLARGSGLEGLTGMASRAPFPVAGLGALELVRPLLCFTHEQLVSTLQAMGQDWIEDPSNANQRFQRARMRTLAPRLAEVGLTSGRIADAMAHLQRANDVIRDDVAALTSCSVTYEPWGYALLAPGPFAAAHREVALRALSRVLKAIGGAAYAPEFDQTSDVLDWAVSGKGPRGRTVGGCRLSRREAGDILIAREEEVLLAEAPVEPISAGQTVLWDQRFEVSLPESAGPDVFEVRALGAAGLRSVEGRTTMAPVEPNRIGRSLPGIWRGERLLSAPLLGFHADLTANARFLAETDRWKQPFSRPRHGK